MKKAPKSGLLFIDLAELIAPARLETIAAINRLLTAGLERNHGVCAAAGADCRIHLPFGTAVESATAAVAIHTGLLFAGGAAGRATSRFVGETLGCKKLLFTRSKSEFLVAFLTNFDFVLIH